MNKKFIFLGALLLPIVSIFGCNKGGGGYDPKNPDTIPLNFKCLSEKATVSIYFSHDIIATPQLKQPDLEYKLNNESWKKVTFKDTEIYKPFSLEKNDVIYFRGENPNGFNSDYEVEDAKEVRMLFTSAFNEKDMAMIKDGDLSVQGNVMSLISKIITRI